MERRTFVVGAVIFLVLLFTGQQSAIAQTAKPIELKFSHWMSTMHNLHAEVFTPFVKEVEERTKGRVKITIYPAEALGKARDHYDMVANGNTDMALFIQAYTPGRFPLTSVIELPIMHVPSAKVGSKVIWELYPKYLTKEYPGVKFLSMWTHEPGHVHMAKKPVRVLEDIKGVRLRSPGPMQTQMLRELGASPLTMPVTDLYDALQRGMADGTVISFSAVKDFKLYEVLKYHTLSNLYVLTMGVVINPKVWDGLPPDVQKVLTDLTSARMSEMGGASFDKYDLLGRDLAKKAGAQITSLSPEEQKRWDERMKPVTDKWITDMEAKHLPGKQLFEEAHQLVTKYSK